MSESMKPSVSRRDFERLVRQAKEELNLRDQDFVNLPSVKRIRREQMKWTQRHRALLYSSLVMLMIAVPPAYLYHSITSKNFLGNLVVRGSMLYMDNEEGFTTESCLLPIPELWVDPFRPPIDCSACVGVKDAKIVYNISPQEFVEKYAFSMQPLLVKDGQVNWTAHDVFDFEYFRSIYTNNSGALEKVMKRCQFFPYQTEFRSFEEFLNMSESRVLGGEGEKPWYIGWSNCDARTALELRKHYRLPYFLPPELEHSRTDWIFMGLPGYGANMHIDAVDAVSWQAQIRGTKKWMLETVPECWGICKTRIEVIVSPGDIIVIDTNRWRHATEIIGNETSIVIGSEYF